MKKLGYGMVLGNLIVDVTQRRRQNSGIIEE